MHDPTAPRPCNSPVGFWPSVNGQQKVKMGDILRPGTQVVLEGIGAGEELGVSVQVVDGGGTAGKSGAGDDLVEKQ